MFKYLKEYRFYITLFLFIAIPLAALDLENRKPREFRWTDKVLLGIVSPIQTAVTWTLENTIDGVFHYIALWNAQRDNEILIQENKSLLQKIQELSEAQNENTRLKNILDFKEKTQLKFTVARVIAKDPTTEFRTLRINRGSKAGIVKGMAVVSQDGIVGRILRVTESYSDVVTLLDLLSAVDAIVERSRARGVVEGFTDELCQLKFVLRTDDIQLGDRLISSGLAGIFPKSVPVGIVTRVTKKRYGITQEVEVRPAVDINRLEEVMVVTEQQILVENKAEGKASEHKGELAK